MDEIPPTPVPVSDPAADGLPETADDDSHADVERDGIRIADGWAPAPMPGDRGDLPAGLDYGTTAEEHQHGEPLDGRLARELPDVTAAGVHVDPDPYLAADADPHESARLADDSESLVADDPVDPCLDSPVSMYDRPVPGVPQTTTVGHLVRGEVDGYSDTDPDEVAEDVGAAGGAFSGEEAAMHEMSPREVDAWEGEHEPYVTDSAGADRLAAPYDAAIDDLVIRTGADQPWDPEDLAVAEGRDPTPENVERARRELRRWGAAAIEKTVP